MWVEPIKNFNYRDPYWLVISPWKKYENYANLRSIQDNLKQMGCTSKNQAFITGVNILNFYFIMNSLI